MAFVPVSEKTVERVMDQLDEMKVAELNRMLNPMHPFPESAVPDDIMELVQGSLWQGHGQLRTQLPKEWLVSDTHFRVEVATEAGAFEFGIARIDGMPPGTLTYGTHPLSIDPYCPLMEKMVAYVRVEKEIHIKFEKIQAQLRGFLGSCKSMNDALKQFPDLVHYLPDDMKASIAFKPESKRKAPAVEAARAAVGFDSALITSVAVANIISKE